VKKHVEPKSCPKTPKPQSLKLNAMEYIRALFSVNY